MGGSLIMQPSGGATTLRIATFSITTNGTVLSVLHAECRVFKLLC